MSDMYFPTVLILALSCIWCWFGNAPSFNLVCLYRWIEDDRIFTPSVDRSGSCAWSRAFEPPSLALSHSACLTWLRPSGLLHPSNYCPPAPHPTHPARDTQGTRHRVSRQALPGLAGNDPEPAGLASEVRRKRAEQRKRKDGGLEGGCF